MAVLNDFAQRPNNIGLKLVIHRQVRVFPVAQHTETHEILFLPVHLTACILPAFLTKCFDVDLDAGLADLLFNLVLNRQPVAIPAGHIRSIIATQSTGLDDDILQYFIDRMTDMNIAICVGRAIVQNEFLSAVTLLTNFFV